MSRMSRMSRMNGHAEIGICRRSWRIVVKICPKIPSKARGGWNLPKFMYRSGQRLAQKPNSYLRIKSYHDKWNTYVFPILTDSNISNVKTQHMKSLNVIEHLKRCLTVWFKLISLVQAVFWHAKSVPAALQVNLRARRGSRRARFAYGHFVALLTGPFSLSTISGILEVGMMFLTRRKVFSFWHYSKRRRFGLARSGRTCDFYSFQGGIGILKQNQSLRGFYHNANLLCFYRLYRTHFTAIQPFDNPWPVKSVLFWFAIHQLQWYTHCTYIPSSTDITLIQNQKDSDTWHMWKFWPQCLSHSHPLTINRYPQFTHSQNTQNTQNFPSWV